jgi:hypothetical protein
MLYEDRRYEAEKAIGNNYIYLNSRSRMEHPKGMYDPNPKRLAGKKKKAECQQDPGYTPTRGATQVQHPAAL